MVNCSAHWKMMVGFGCVGLLCSCADPEPCFPKSKGKEYRVNIIEVWDETSRFPGGIASNQPCPTDFDLIPGSVTAFRIDGFNSDTLECKCGEGTITQAPGDWSWEWGEPTLSCSVGFFQTTLRVARENCEGYVILYVDCKKIPTGVSIAGERPVATLTRVYQGRSVQSATTGDCMLSVCNDTFAVEIEEL